MNNTPKKWTVIIVTILALFLLSSILAGIYSVFLPFEDTLLGNVALIKIEGAIVGEKWNNPLSSEMVSSSDIIEFIHSAEENPSIEALVFEINSPGGTAVASKEIADAIKRADKPTFAVIREIGTSGAYWAASAADYIIASELSLTGSIGVISSYLEFSGLFEKYGITYRRLVAGKYKDIGSPFKDLTGEEELLLQAQLDEIHRYFISQIAQNRALDPAYVENISTGMFYLGTQAKELSLVDYLGDMETAKGLIKEQLNLTKVEFSVYKKERTFLDVLSEVFSEQSFNVGRGIGSSFISGSNKGIMT